MPRQICLCEIMLCKCKHVKPENRIIRFKIIPTDQRKFWDEISIIPDDPRKSRKNYCCAISYMKIPQWGKNQSSFELSKCREKNVK